MRIHRLMSNSPDNYELKARIVNMYSTTEDYRNYEYSFDRIEWRKGYLEGLSISLVFLF